ncbi:MAG: Nramp family divalent metal transporter [Herbinix sp.]|nr:Nramp family divalent metal transporter [Herbinix sp.]
MKIIPGTHQYNKNALKFFNYLGPGLLVTVGFIDPGNWASNIAAGSKFGYVLLWMVTLSTIMLILLQHNAAHLGIVTGKCLSEAVTEYMRPWPKNIVLLTSIGAAISTALAEILGAAIALNMLFHLPIKVSTLLILVVVICLQFTNSYKKIEKIIIGFVSLIGLSFLFEICIVHIDWVAATTGWVVPAFPKSSMPVIMSVLGAVVMPHNLFLHSEIIQSRQWNLQDEKVIRKQLKYEFGDTLISMIIGWAINSSMILMAAATFYSNHIEVSDLSQAQAMLKPLLGNTAEIVFAIALLFSGLSSCITAGMAGGTIFAGRYAEPYNITDIHTKIGIMITMIPAAFIIFFISSPFDGLIYSQMILSIQLPLTVFSLIYLTSSKKVMGKYANSMPNKVMLWFIGLIVAFLNIALLISYL